jgi:hypothetical protein
MRYQKVRSVPAGAVKVQSKQSPALVFVFASSKGKPSVKAFVSEKAVNHCGFYSFASPAAREKWVREFFAGQAARAAAKAKRAAEKKAWVPDFKVGDILKGSWGYDQTNVDYFEVVAVKGKMLEICELEQEQSGDGYGGSSKCVPLPGAYAKPERFRVRAQQGGVKSPVHGYLHKMEPKIIAGVPVYEASYWSADH